METSKVALRLAYMGTSYDGFQRQVGRPSIQAAIVEALCRSRLIHEVKGAHLRASGRTDKGVHATDFVISFETNTGALATPRRINAQLPADIWMWARADVPRTFDARRDAILREYQYFLCGGPFNVRAMREASDLMHGVHDFSNFSRERQRSTVRTIFSSDVRELGSCIVIKVAADSFVWNMVRKLVSALELVGSGQRSVEWFADMLNPASHVEGIRSAPASGLVLTRVEYADVEFAEDAYTKKKALQHIERAMLRNNITTQVLRLFSERMSGKTA